MAKEIEPPSVPHITPEMLGWTPETDPVETAAIVNRAIALAVERGVPFFDNAVRRIAGTIRLGGKVVMEFGTKHRWIADYRDLSRFDTVEQVTETGGVAEPRHIFINTAGARGSILRGPMWLSAARVSNMTLAGRASIPASLVAFTASAVQPSAEISIEAITIEGFGFGLYQGSQKASRSNILPYVRMRVGTAIFRFCNTAIETGEWGNGLDDATFEVLRVSRCGNFGVLRGTDLSAMSVFDFGLDHEKDAEPGEVRLEAGLNEAQFTGFNPERGTVIALQNGRDKPGFVAVVERVEGNRAILSHTPNSAYSGKFVANPPSFILHGSAVNSMHFYVEGLHDIPLALRQRSKISIQDFKVSRGSFTARGGAPVSIMGAGTSVDLSLHPRSVENPMVAGMVGLLTPNAAVSGRIVSGARLGSENAAVLDTRALSVGRGRPSSAIQGYYTDTAGTLPIVEI